jgi:tryptophanyl-tRNA synthetase
MSIVMDSRTPAEPKPDADRNLAIQLLRLVAPVDVARGYEDRLRAGGLGYGELKKELFEQYWSYFASARARRAELKANLDHVHAVMQDGAQRARQVARVVLDRARRNCGIA